MALNAQVRRLIDNLTPEEKADLVLSLPQPPRLLLAPDLIALLASLPTDRGLADDIEAGVRANRSEPESSSPWEH